MLTTPALLTALVVLQQKLHEDQLIIQVALDTSILLLLLNTGHHQRVDHYARIFIGAQQIFFDTERKN